MKNQKIKKNIRVFTFLLLFISMAFLLGGFIVNSLLQTTEENSVKKEVVDKTNLYRTQIIQQLDADIQTLNTLKNFLVLEEDMNNRLQDGLNESHSSNRFLRMSLVYENQEVYHATMNEDIKMVNYDSLSETVKESIAFSWLGSASVSDIYFDDDLNQEVIAISVPVFKNGKIDSILIAFDEVEEFQNTASIATGDRFSALISKNGDIIIPSFSPLVDKSITTIYEFDPVKYNASEIQHSLEAEMDCYMIFNYDNKKYSLYFTPVEIHDWYALKVQPFYTIQQSLVGPIDTTTIIYLIIVMIGTGFVLYSLKTFRKSMDFIEKFAYYDELTQLPNNHRFKEYCHLEIKEGQPYTIILLNIKNFQRLNDTFGEQNADQVLQVVAQAINGFIDQQDFCCRDNADQFMIYLKETNQQKINLRIHSIEELINQYFIQNHYDYNIELSIGICVGDYPYQKAVSNALWAMKKSKELKQTAVYFDQELLNMVEIKNDIEISMHNALKNEEFKLFLQPKFNLDTQKIVGAEALVRWIKDDKTMYFPDQFIPIFEKNGFCVDLDLYMLEKVCQKLREWIDNDYPIYPISVNQTKLLFYRTDYVDLICEIIQKYNISPQWIILEVLEGLAIEDLETFNKNIENLHRHGFKISLDDFGSGYSSLSSLNELLVDEIKIDRKFMTLLNDTTDPQQNHIFERIISLVSSLVGDVVIEGVETSAHVELLKRMECHYAQGYFFSRPIPCEEFELTYLKKPLTYS